MSGGGAGGDDHGGGWQKAAAIVGVILVVIFALKGLGASLGVQTQVGPGQFGFSVGRSDGRRSGITQSQYDELREIYR